MSDKKKKLREITMAKEIFVLEYMLTGPYSEYVNVVALTTRDIVEWQMEEQAKQIGGKAEGPEKFRKDLLKKNEDPDEWVIIVGLRKPLPEGMELPKTYKGFKVFVLAFIGEITPA